jgi:hypothetical protein
MRRAEWDAKDTVVANYEHTGLVRDPNAGFGRNKRLDVIQEKAQDAAVLEAELDDGECWQEWRTWHVRPLAACRQMHATQASGSEWSVLVDADLKAACNQQRSSGKAPPKRLTPHQRQIVQRLIAAHGDDTKVGEGEVVKHRNSPCFHSLFGSLHHPPQRTSWGQHARPSLRLAGPPTACIPVCMHAILCTSVPSKRSVVQCRPYMMHSLRGGCGWCRP